MGSIKGLEVIQEDLATWLLLAYYGADALSFVRKCQACQLHGDRIHAPAVELDSSSTPWPFRTWAFDLLVVSIHLHENMYGFLLQQCYTK